MTRYALVNSSDVITQERDLTRLDLNAGVKAGYRWVIINKITNDNSTGPDKLTEPMTETIFPDRVDRVRTIRDMTAQEITDKDAAEADFAYNSQVKALGLILLDEVNILRTGAGLATRSTAQLRNAFDAKYKQVK